MSFSGFVLFLTGSVVFILLQLICYSSGSQVVTIDVHKAKDFLVSGHCYLDVRTVDEYKKGHVDSPTKILNIPYMFNTPEGRVKNPDFLKEVASLCMEDDQIVVGCQSGVRSLYAIDDLQNVGYKNLSNMGGGYLAWVDNGFPIKVDDKAEEMPKEAELVDDKPEEMPKEAELVDDIAEEMPKDAEL